MLATWQRAGGWTMGRIPWRLKVRQTQRLAAVARASSCSGSSRSSRMERRGEELGSRSPMRSKECSSSPKAARRPAATQRRWLMRGRGDRDLDLQWFRLGHTQGSALGGQAARQVLLRLAGDQAAARRRGGGAAALGQGGLALGTGSGRGDLRRLRPGGHIRWGGRVGMTYPAGATSWDISPGDKTGRAAMAWAATGRGPIVASIYLWTG